MDQCVPYPVAESGNGNRRTPDRMGGLPMGRDSGEGQQDDQQRGDNSNAKRVIRSHGDSSGEGLGCRQNAGGALPHERKVAPDGKVALEGKFSRRLPRARSRPMGYNAAQPEREDSMSVRTLSELFLKAASYNKPDCLLSKIGGTFQPISTAELVD